MKPYFSNSKFYKDLEAFLPTSTMEQRKVWATTIVEKNIDIKELSYLLKGERKIAIRFLWFLTEVGQLNPDKLFIALPFLFDLCEHRDPVYKTSFASYWLISGIPPENEGRAIEQLFQWLLSANTNVTIKAPTKTTTSANPLMWHWPISKPPCKPTLPT